MTPAAGTSPRRLGRAAGDQGVGAASLDGGRFGASGTINLADQAVRLHATAVLSSGFGRAVGGISVGGIMNTVLANEAGELVVPILVTGTLQNPQFAPDVERVVEMKVRNMVPRIGSPQDPVTGLLGIPAARGTRRLRSVPSRRCRTF